MSEEYTYYVLGFAFTEDLKNVLLIEKKTPEWMAGKFNGVGGKIEDDDDTIFTAMSREFKEETSVDISREEWVLMYDHTGDDYHISIFAAVSDDIRDFKQTEDEVPFLVSVSDIESIDCVEGVQEYIHRAFDPSNLKLSEDLFNMIAVVTSDYDCD